MKRRRADQKAGGPCTVHARSMPAKISLPNGAERVMLNIFQRGG